MKELNGVWWTVNQHPVPGILIITDENKITLRTYEKLSDAGVINGVAAEKKITLVDVVLDRTDVYIKPEELEEKDDIIIKSIPEVKYFTYTYIAQIVILGNNYERKGDIRIENLWLKYTNLPQWIDWENEYPTINKNKEKIIMEFNKFPEKRIQLERFDMVIRKPYFFVTEEKYKMQLNNEIGICIENIKNQYINSVSAIVECVRNFFILCMGDNINVEQITVWDSQDRKSEMILSQSKSDYENRSILKNIVKYSDIENDMETILKNWYELYEDNELLIANFSNLQTREEPIISEYTNLIGAIENLFLVTIKKKSTKVNFAEILKTLMKDTNFILDLTEEEIQRIAISAKEIRRYGVHSNKEPKEEVINKTALVASIMTFLVEVIRARIMLELGINKEILEKYYKSIENLKGLKKEITEVYIEDRNIYVKNCERNKLESMMESEANDTKVTVNPKSNNSEKKKVTKKAVKQEVKNIEENEEDIELEEIEEFMQFANQLSREDTNEIAELNAIMGTSYREVPYDLSNAKDLIEATTYITAEYIDYHTYWIMLENIAENFDQSLEVFNPQNWMRMLKEDGTGNDLIDKNISILNKASDYMWDLLRIAEEKCKKIWKVILVGNNIEAKEHFLGKFKSYSEDEFEEIWEDVIENIGDIGHRNVVEEDCKNFAEKMKKRLEEE